MTYQEAKPRLVDQGYSAMVLCGSIREAIYETAAEIDIDISEGEVIDVMITILRLK